MVSFRSILAIAPFLATALAKVAFTSVPAVAVVSQSYNISWAGGDGTPVTLTLRRGDPANLATISTIADQASGNYYIWTVPSSVQSGNDYALQITQGQSDINYSGLFTISGGSSSSSSGSSSSSANATPAGNSTMSVTSFSSPAGTGTAMTRNSTFSTATLTSSTSKGYAFGNTGTSTGSSASQTGTSRSTSAPSNDAPVRAGSSAALILGIVAAVMLH